MTDGPQFLYCHITGRQRGLLVAIHQEKGVRSSALKARSGNEPYISLYKSRSSLRAVAKQSVTNILGIASSFHSSQWHF